MNEFQKAQNAKILSCYNTDENLSELRKAEILDIEKGGKRALIGEKRTFGGREYIKTAEGWKFHGKGTGTKAQEHVAGATAKVEEKPDSIETERETLKDKINEARNLFAQTKPRTWKYEEAALKLRAAEKQLKEFEAKNPKGDIPSKPTESPKAEESKLQGKVGEKITVSGYYESPIEAKVTRSTPTNIHIEFSNGDGLVIPKEHYLKGVTDHGYKKDAVKITPSITEESESKETPKTEKVAEEKKDGAEVTIGRVQWKFDDKAMSNLSSEDRQSIVEMIGERGYLSKESLPEAENKVEIAPGGEYSLTQFSKSLSKVSADAAKRRFLKENENGYYDYSKDERVPKEKVAELVFGVGNNYNIYNYFNKNYKPNDIEIKNICSIKEKVESSSIYTLMAAKQYDVKEISFKVRVKYTEAPITVKTRILVNSTLSMRDISSFM